MFQILVLKKMNFKLFFNIVFYLLLHLEEILLGFQNGFLRYFLDQFESVPIDSKLDLELVSIK